MTAHTPTPPLTVEEVKRIFHIDALDDYPRLVQIVRAVNNHAALAAALKIAERMVAFGLRTPDDGELMPCASADAGLRAIRAALAKAKE